MQQENSELKLKIKEINNSFEQEKLEITLNQREIELTIKQQKVNFDGERLQLLGTIQKLESEIFKLSNSAKLKSYEKQNLNDTQKNYISDLQKSFATEKEELIRENKKIREDSEKSLNELKALYENEKDGLRKTIKDLQKKLKNNLDVIEELKDQSSDFIEIRNQELECQIEYYKELYLNSTKNAAQQKNLLESGEKQRFLDNIEILHMQNDKIQLELEKSQLEVKKLKMDINKNQEKYWENERNLKNEIKMLIGKLMKAKSKLESEIDLKETLKKDTSCYSNRSSSSSRSKNSQLYY